MVISLLLPLSGGGGDINKENRTGEKREEKEWKKSSQKK
jgi:hypothetical protein